MTFQSARNYKMPFGKHKGQTLDGVASTDEGLQYLDWLRGEREGREFKSEFDRALETYLGDPSIAEELGRIRR